MKKIKNKIIGIYNGYIISINRYIISIKNSIIIIKNSIIKRIKKFQFHTLAIRAFISFISLNFLKSNKLKTSILSRYLILLIFLLFSYLFYLSIPALYHTVEVQKYLSKKLSNEFNLNAALSANITYKILPSPNFEISNVILGNDSKDSFENFADVKKMKIYVKVKKLYNLKKLEVKKIALFETNFNLNKKNFSFINNFIKEKKKDKKIEIKKSQIFFGKGQDKTNVIALYKINRGKLFYDDKEDLNKLDIIGTIYNTKLDINFSKSIYENKVVNSFFNFRDINTKIKNELISTNNGELKGKLKMLFLGSDINAKYNINNKIISLSSGKSSLNKKKINFEGIIHTDPFHYNINIALNELDFLKFLENLLRAKGLLKNKILLNNNFNGKISITIKELASNKLFDSAFLNLKFLNGKLVFDDSFLKSKKIGKLKFFDSSLKDIDDEQIFRSKILFEISDQKNFYKKFQILKSKRINLKNIYFELENNFNTNEIILNKFIINSKISNKTQKEELDLTHLININEIKDLKNWIEMKKFCNEIFSQIN